MKLLNQFMMKSRESKHKQFMDFCKPEKTDLVLDVGAQNKQYKDTDNFLEQHYPFVENITALAIERLDDFKKRYPLVKTVVYGGKIFPFRKNSFDLLFSNAVIEHVGDINQQEIFVSEMFRVTKKKIFFTTPNRGFPLEIHTRLPLVHWFSNKKSDWFYIKFGKKWASGDYMHLLYKKDLVTLLEKMKNKYIFTYKIKNNRFLGLTATFTVLIEKK